MKYFSFNLVKYGPIGEKTFPQKLVTKNCLPLELQFTAGTAAFDWHGNIFLSKPKTFVHRNVVSCGTKSPVAGGI